MGVMNIALYSVFCVVCMSAALHFIQVIRYVRCTYPSIWTELGFAGNGWWVEAAAETTDLAAMRRFRRFIRSKAREDLHDIHLNRMILIDRTLTYLGVLLFLVVAIMSVVN
jgi:hypothetical protein